ncbi:MAG: hypothetical protein K1X48_02310 [Burkholderiaceae bacterium]|nr:hypothetical protein [Burkholderiaceae bacterium]
MKLIDQVTLEELLLPNDLLWSDEFDWSPVEATNTYTLTGSLIIEQGTKQAGRPISLSAEPDMAFVTRATVQTLRNWAAIAGRKFKLVFQYPSDTRQFLVVFNHADEPISAEPVKGFPGHESNDWFRISLKFLEVTV